MRRSLYPRASYPQGHTDLAISLNNLGVLLMEQGEYGKARPFLEEARVVYEAMFPTDSYPQGHPDRARSLNNLAILHPCRPHRRQSAIIRSRLSRPPRWHSGTIALAQFRLFINKRSR